MTVMHCWMSACSVKPCLALSDPSDLTLVFIEQWWDINCTKHSKLPELFRRELLGKILGLCQGN